MFHDRGRGRGLTSTGGQRRPRRPKEPKDLEAGLDPAGGKGPMILTRAELQRRTRERSRLAALKLAQEHGKARAGAGKASAVERRGGVVVGGWTVWRDRGVEREREREREREEWEGRGNERCRHSSPECIWRALHTVLYSERVSELDSTSSACMVPPLFHSFSFLFLCLKEREQRETVKRRKSAAKALADQARQDNAVRFRRDGDDREAHSAGPAEIGRWRRSRGLQAGAGKSAADWGGARARSHSPRAFTTAAARGRAELASAANGSRLRRGGGADGDQGVHVVAATSKHPQHRHAHTGQQQQQQQQQQTRHYRARTSATAASATTYGQQQQRTSRPRLSRSVGATPTTSNKHEEPPLPPLRRRVLRSGGTGGGHSKPPAVSMEKRDRGSSCGSGGGGAVAEAALVQPQPQPLEGREVGTRGDIGKDWSCAAAAAPTPLEQTVPVPASSSPILAAADAAAVPHVTADAAVRERAPASVARATRAAATAAAVLDPDRGPDRGRGGPNGNTNASTYLAESRRRREEAATREEGERQEAQRRRRRERGPGGGVNETSTEDRHRKTLAFMARQRKQAIMEKRRAEQEKQENAENLRRALEVRTEDRFHDCI